MASFVLNIPISISGCWTSETRLRWTAFKTCLFAVSTGLTCSALLIHGQVHGLSDTPAEFVGYAVRQEDSRLVDTVSPQWRSLCLQRASRTSDSITRGSLMCSSMLVTSGTTPSICRLSELLQGFAAPVDSPGFASFRLLGEIAGSYLLHWMTLAGGGVAIHLLIRNTLKDRLVAAVIAVVWVCSTSGHGPGGWNYHALAAAAYYLLACWLIVRTASGSSPRSGVLAGASFRLRCSHLHLLCVLHTAGAVAIPRVAAAHRHSGMETLWGHVAWMSAGGLGITLVLAAINAASGGRWLFFMTELQATIFLTQPGNDTWWSRG